MSRSTRIELLILAIVVVLLATPFLLPVNVWRSPIETAASMALGREVQVRGPLHLSIYPDIGLRLSDVSVANAAGARNPQMIVAKSIVVGARIAPLLSGRLEVTELTLQGAKIALETGEPSRRISGSSQVLENTADDSTAEESSIVVEGMSAVENVGPSHPASPSANPPGHCHLP